VPTTDKPTLSPTPVSAAQWLLGSASYAFHHKVASLANSTDHRACGRRTHLKGAFLTVTTNNPSNTAAAGPADRGLHLHLHLRSEA
jgi:hypothetical protein